MVTARSGSAASGAEIYSTGIITPTPGVLTVVTQSGCAGIQASSPGAVCAGDYTGDPKLGALQDNGGGTNTMALGPGSSAINTGYDAGCLSSDQVFGGYFYGNSYPAGYYDDIIASPDNEGLVALLYS